MSGVCPNVPDAEMSRAQLLAELEACRRRNAELEGHGNDVQALFDALPDFVYFKDRERRFVRASQSFCWLFGLALDEILGKRDEELFPPEIARETMRDDQRVIESGEPLIGKVEGSDELIWVLTSKVPWRDSQGRIIGLLGVSRDISEQRRAEQQLRESKRRFRAFYEAAFEAVAISERGRMVDVNERLVQLVGYPRDALIGTSVAQLVAPEDRELVERRIREGYTAPYEHRLLCRDGSRIEVEVCGRPIQYQGRNCRITAIHDIRWRKQAERERLEFEAKVQQAQKLESLGVLAGGIAHDFNNLLMGMMGNAQLALAHLPAQGPGTSYLGEILKAVRRAADLTRQMLAYSGRGNLIVENVDLNALIRDLHSLLSSAIPRKVSLRLALEPDLPGLIGDATQLRQIVLNLVTNAAEAIGETSGRVAVRTSVCEPQDLPAGTDLDAQRTQLLLEVSDTGCGMDEDTLAKVFDPFFTTKFTGRGLGLAAVQGIVRAHEGSVEIETAPGEGTTFRLWFPASAEPPVSPGEQEQEPAPWRGEGVVLLADDEEAVREVCAETLEWMGFTVLTARDGAEAVQIFAQHDEIACVLLDLNMPVMDGIEAFTEMHSLRPQVPVILSSGYCEQESTEPIRRMGLAGFIQKPYELDALKETLRSVLEG